MSGESREEFERDRFGTAGPRQEGAFDARAWINEQYNDGSVAWALAILDVTPNALEIVVQRAAGQAAPATPLLSEEQVRLDEANFWTLNGTAALSRTERDHYEAVKANAQR